MALRIFTLGTFRVQHDDTPVAEASWKTLKNKTLLQLVLTARHHPLTREQLIEYLWPHLDPSSGDRNLRVAVSQLRHTLSAVEKHSPRTDSAREPFILTTDRGYAWNHNAEYWLDADEFETLVRVDAAPGERQDSASDERARQLYRGEYLAEERYADWAIAERERLRELYFALLTRMAEEYARRGHYRRAVALTREILAADRVRESVWCQLMLYHYHAGDPALALRAYGECRAALAQELDAEPLDATNALADQIRARRVTAGHAYPPPPALERLRDLPVSLGRLVFVGREREWGALARQWDAVTQARGRVVLIQGEPGVGKTRLAEELVAYARHAGATALEGKGREFLADVLPFQSLIDALRSAPPAQTAALTLDPLWRVELARLVPEWSPAKEELPQAANPSRLFEAFTRLCLRLAEHAPLVLFLDDVQWLDETTIRLLAYARQRLESQRVLFLLTARLEPLEPSGALAAWLNELQRSATLHRIPLEPLSREATIELVREASHASPHADEIAAQLYAETRGYPLFLVALLRAHFEDGLLYADEPGQWAGTENLLARGANSPVPETIQSIFSQRIRQLDSRGQRFLTLAAVLGRPFDLEWMQSALDDSAAAVLDDLDAVRERHLVRAIEMAHGFTYDLSHDLLRRVIVNALSPERRMRAHRRVLAALEATALESAENAAELAHHARLGRLWQATIRYSIRAAEHALESYAIQEAARHCEQGLAALDAPARGGEKMEAREQLRAQYDLLAAKQLASHLLGTRDAALLDRLLALARELNDAERLAKAYHALLRFHIDTGQNGAALDLVPLYEPLLERGVSARTAMGFYQRVGFLYYRTGDYERALHYHDAAFALAQTSGDTHWQAYVLNTRGTVLMCLGKYQAAMADYSRAAELWDSSARHIFRTFALDNRADVLYYVGQYETALATKQVALARYREFGYPIAEAECLCEIGMSLRELGRTAEAEQFLRQGIELANKLEDSFDLVQGLNGFAILLLDRQDSTAWGLADEYAARAVEQGTRANLPHAVIQGLAYRARAHLRPGHLDEALELSARAVALLQERSAIEGTEEEIYFIHCQALAANGRLEEAATMGQRAFDEMMTKADLLTDATLRSSFLERVRVNRQIRDWRSAVTTPSPSPSA